MATSVADRKDRNILKRATVQLATVAAATDLPDPTFPETVTMGVLENGDIALKLKIADGTITTGTLAVVYA